LLDRARIAELAEKLEPDLLRGFLLEAVIEAETARRRLGEFAAQLEEAGRVAHRLRGTSLNLGLTRVGRLAAAIESDTEQSERLAALIEELGETVVATREAVFRLHLAGLGGRSVPPRARVEAPSNRNGPAPADPSSASGLDPGENAVPAVAAGDARRPARTEASVTGQQRAIGATVDGQQTAVNVFIDGVHGFAVLPGDVVKLDLYEERVDYDPESGSDLTTRRRHVVARLTMTRFALGRMLYQLATKYRVSER